MISWSAGSSGCCASSGLLDQSDVDQVAAVIEPGSLAGIPGI
jgi:hypothetical protein